jgi:hypothetical protein
LSERAAEMYGVGECHPSDALLNSTTSTCTASFHTNRVKKQAMSVTRQ